MKSILKKVIIAGLSLVMAAQSPAAERSGVLCEGETATYTIHLHPGDRVHACAEGDEDVFDLDILIYCPDGVCTARDTASDPEPEVNFTAYEHGRYTIVVSMEATRRGRAGRFWLEVETN